MYKYEFIDWHQVTNNFAQHKDVNTRLIYGKKSDHIPLITIAIPAYKRADLLKEGLDSIMRQKNFTDFEVMVIDDYSEGSEEMDQLMEEYTNRYHNISCYRNDKNIGMGANWNRCIELTRSKWLVLLHDDDMLCDNFLEKVYPIAEATQCSLAGVFQYKLKQIDDNGKSGEKYIKRLSKAQTILSKSRKGKAFQIKTTDLFKFIQPSPGCWIINRNKAIELGGYDVNRMKSGIIDGPFNFKNTYHAKTIIIPQLLSIRRFKENDFLREDAQIEILCGIYNYVRHFIDEYGKYRKWHKLELDISIMYFIIGLKAKYNSKVDFSPYLDQFGVSNVVRRLPDIAIRYLDYLLMVGLIFRKEPIVKRK